MIAFLNVGKVKINNVLVMKDIYFNERFNLTLCSSKATNTCDDQVLEMQYLWKDNNIISSTNNMFKLKENKDKIKNFNILNGATFDLNFVMKENIIIVYFYKDGSRIDLELEYESGSKMDDIEINVVKIEKGSITDETIFNKEIIKLPYSKDLGAENHLKSSNILKFEFEFMKMEKNGIGIILLQQAQGTIIKAAKILKTVGEPTSLKEFCLF
uniref:Uncharacterized protein n=1 Tax=Meloidogyne hapla TaxID=6305 RepID=A0A1I8B5M0_MELHA